MKKPACLVLLIIAFTACQKSIDNRTASRENNPAYGARDSGVFAGDSLVIPGDMLTYEVITSDPGGWAGMWNDSTGNLVSNLLDSVTYGSPIYLNSGWKYSFVCPSKPFQALISVAARSYRHSITVNLYKNGSIIKSTSNDAMTGFAKLLFNTDSNTLTGTTRSPLLTYEILISEQDTSHFESNGWVGQWNRPTGVVNDLHNPLLSSFAIPSGWKYRFKPDKLPFTMYVAASPYSPNGAKVTVNFYVNGQMVKSVAARDRIYGMRYIVQ